jgi:YidC/Oxa1 family membrane protein insertase
MFKDKNTIIGFLLIFAIIIGFGIINTPSKEEIEKKRQQEDSLRLVELKQERLKEDSAALANAMKEQNDTLQIEEEVIEEESQTSDTLTTEKKQTQVFGKPQTEEFDLYYIENDLLRIGISEIGAKIHSVELKEYLKYDKTPLMLFEDNLNVFGLSFLYNNMLVNTDELLFFSTNSHNVQADNTLKLDENSTDTLLLSLRLYPMLPDSTEQAGEWIEFSYSIVNGSYAIGFEITFHNMKEFLPQNISYVNFEMQADLNQQEKSFDNEKAVTTMYYSFMDGDVDYLSERKDDLETLTTRFKWVSFKQQFFSFVLIADEGFQSGEISAFANEDNFEPEYLRSLKASIVIPFENEETNTIPMTIYAGPNKYNILKDFDLGLERQIPLGWSFFLMQWINRYAVIPVFNFLESYNINYGIIILILTLLLKIVLFPIAYKTYLSSARMKALKPDIDEIGKKFPKKEDSMKKQQATMELYKKAGVNPMAGCLPMLLQFPILIAMFRFFPASIELRQEAFLWADDLSSYDSILELGFNIPFYGSHVSLFTLLMTVSTIIYTRINSKMMATSTQMPGMKTMMYLMPIMFLGFFNSYSSALSYYYFLANMITFAQMAVFNKLVNEDAIRAKISANKKKPVKKSGFQRRLEEMSKKQQMQQKKK